MRRRGALVLVLLAVLGVVATAPAWAVVRPGRDGPVLDAASVFGSSDTSAVRAGLTDLRTETGVDVALVTVPSTDGESIEAFGAAMFDAWAVGGTSREGVLVAVAVTDRKVRIEVGEPVRVKLSPAEAKGILDARVLPRFKAGDLAGGVRAGLEAIASALGGSLALGGSDAARASGDAIEPDGGSSNRGVLVAIGVAVVLVVGIAATVRSGNRGGGGGRSRFAGSSGSYDGGAAYSSYDSSSSSSDSGSSSSSDSSGASGDW